MVSLRQIILSDQWSLSLSTHTHVLPCYAPHLVVVAIKLGLVRSLGAVPVTCSWHVVFASPVSLPPCEADVTGQNAPAL